MSAKPSKKSAKREASRIATPAATTSIAASVGAHDSTVAAAEPTKAWIDSTDPRKRLIGKIVLVGIWVYVAALWLLALDQTFHWGIFGPKTPPLP